MQTATFGQLWRNFESAGTVLDGRYDTVRWKAQEGMFAAAVIRIDREALGPAFDDFQAALTQLEIARVHPNHFLHIMLQELGQVADEPTGRHQITKDRLEEFTDAAAASLSSASPFELKLGGVNAFRDAVILEVHDNGVLSRIHQRLHELAAAPNFSPYAYLPHLTVAHFVGDRSSSDVVRELRQWRSQIFGQMTVIAVDIVLIDVAETYPLFAVHRELQLFGPGR